jgi:hypothetical protein
MESNKRTVVSSDGSTSMLNVSKVNGGLVVGGIENKRGDGTMHGECSLELLLSVVADAADKDENHLGSAGNSGQQNVAAGSTSSGSKMEGKARSGRVGVRVRRVGVWTALQQSFRAQIEKRERRSVLIGWSVSRNVTQAIHERASTAQAGLHLHDCKLFDTRTHDITPFLWIAVS